MSLQQSLSKSHLTLQPFKWQRHLKLYSAVICGGIITGLISLINLSSDVEYYFLTASQLLLFLVLGFFFTFYQNKISKQESVTFNNQLKFFLFVALSICGSLSLLYVLFENSRMTMAFACSAAFALPFFTEKSWLYFSEIPEQEFEIWIPEKRIDNTASIFLDCLAIKLKLSKNLNDLHDNIYPVHIPYYMKLGDFFSRFMGEQNRNLKSVIEDTDEKKERYAWDFFLTDKYGLQNKRLDPNKSVISNKVKQGSVIHAKRLYEPVKLLSYNKENL